MRLNQYVALHTGLSRRKADELIKSGRVTVNNSTASLGQSVEPVDAVNLDDKPLSSQTTITTIILNKPPSYVASRHGQGSKTIYDLLPRELWDLKPVGRLDKNSSGLLLLTNDGQLANRLTHPSYQKEKVYEIELSRDLTERDFENITKNGVKLEDGISKFKLDTLNDGNKKWRVTMKEGRNRQIRRTFEAISYKVVKLHRTRLGDYTLDRLASAKWKNTV